MNNLHAAPILQAMRSSGSPALRVFDGSVDPKTVPPYVVAYVATTTPESTTFEDVFDRVECTSIVHSVGGTSESARVIADRVWTALLGQTPTVTGRTCSRIRLIDSQPPRRDESTGLLIVDQVDVYQYVSLPG